MTSFVALLRAVNVGGTGKLPMSDLKAMCEQIGCRSVRTYIASGNVVFQSDRSAKDVQAKLESKLEAYAGKPVGVLVRTAEELAAVHAANPFPSCELSKVVAFFLNDAPPNDALARVSGQKNEELRLGLREIYVHFVDGIGTSKLKVPAAARGTSRNMNTIAKLSQMANEDPAV